MHEMGLAQAILDTALDIAGDRPLRRVAVSSGEGQAVSDEALRFSFQLMAEGTGAAGAALEVRIVPGERLLIDEVEVGGNRPEVLRRPDVAVAEAPHPHPHDSDAQPIHPAWL